MKRKLLSAIALLFIFSIGCAFSLAHAKNILPASRKSAADSVDQKWQAISRLRYVLGTIVSYDNNTAGRPSIRIKVETCYHSSTDPVTASDSPFKAGTEIDFSLITRPGINLHIGQKVVLYEGQFTTKDNADFLGAKVKFYEEDGKFIDTDGKEVNLPPVDYPDTL